MTLKIKAPFMAMIAAGALAFTPLTALAHGDVAPQPVNTDALPDMGAAGDDWLMENPYRAADEEVWLTAVSIGDLGYTQNCARCHGLGAVSGGLAPDLRYLEASDYGDEWFQERFRNGYTQNGVTKMPAFEGVLDQKAAWAIKTYVESRPEDGAYDAFSDRLSTIRDRLAVIADDVDGGADASGFADEAASLKGELAEMASGILSASGGDRTDSIALQASLALGHEPPAFRNASDTLTVGLSAAQ